MLGSEVVPVHQLRALTRPFCKVKRSEVNQIFTPHQSDRSIFEIFCTHKVVDCLDSDTGGGVSIFEVLSAMGARGKIWNPSKSKEAWWWCQSWTFLATDR